MKKRLFFPFFPLLLAAACVQKDAAVAMPDVNVELLASAPRELLANEILTLKPAEGHHFETKAPQKCASFPWELLSARVLKCQIAEPGRHLIELSVCDDKKTYCKFVKFALEAQAPKGFKSGAFVSAKPLLLPKHEHPPVPGFYINDPARALADARKEGKLLFVHFYGIWCPPCNMLEEYVYQKKDFMDASRGMVRLMLDADSDVSWEWKSRFKVGGYPTVVAADAELREIDRMVGYRPLGPVLKWLKGVEAGKDEPVETLFARYDKPESAPALARARIGAWRNNRAEYAEAIEWLEGVLDKEARKTYWQAKRSLAGRESDEAAENEALKKLIAEFPDAVEYAGWVEALIAKDKEAGLKKLPAALAALSSWEKSGALGETGYGPEDLAYQRAELLAASGDAAGAKAAYLKAADLYGVMAAKSDLKVARGANLERAYCLHKAGENEKAKALYKELADFYKEEFTFNYDFAYVLNELGERESAYDYARRAEAHAYGDNWLRAMHLKAKLELAMGRKGEAVASVRKALSEAVVPRSTAVRTHGYLARLRSLLAEAEKTN